MLIHRIFQLRIIIASDRRQLDLPGAFSILVIAAILATTIQAQDFQDVKGDEAVGRYTLPVAFPNFSRYTVLVTLVMWSLYLTTMWEITTPAGAGFTFLGITVGIRYYFWRSTKDDEWSYVLYNVRLLSIRLFCLLSGSFIYIYRSGWQLHLQCQVIGACPERTLYDTTIMMTSDGFEILCS